MSSRPDNTRYLRAAEQARRAQLTQHALDAIRTLAGAGHPVNFTTVANVSGCSRSFLNRQPELAAEIRRLRPTTTTLPSPHPPTMSDASAKARVEQLRADNSRLRNENSQLRSQVAALLGQLRSATNVPPTHAPLS